MESSLASLFTEGNLPCLPLSWATSGEGVEELQQQLASASMELQSVREAARFRNRINEAKICHLQGLLNAAVKQRDEALMKCSKLRECLLRFSSSSQSSIMPAAESPCKFLPSSTSATSSPGQFSHPASPAVDAMAFQDMNQTVCGDKCDVSIFEGDEGIPHQATMVQDIFGLQDNPDPSCISMGDSQQQFSMDILNEDVGLDEDESLDLIDLQMERSLKFGWDPNPSGKSSWSVHASNGSSIDNMLLRQSSCISSAGSQAVGELEQPQKFSTSLCKQPATMPSPPISMQTASALPHGMPHLMTLPDVLKVAQPHSGAEQVKAVHAESSEPEATVLKEDTLPEKGKLLQAVMQAGPLLQNLLLAGPLPQWRYPPPQLSTVDIPQVPMAPTSMSHKYASSSLDVLRAPGSMMQKYPSSSSVGVGIHALPIHHSPLLNYPAPSVHAGIMHPQFPDERGVLGSSGVPTSVNMSKGGRNVCWGGRKLRRLSPIGVK